MPLQTPSTVSVSTRRGVFTFETSLTWEEAVIEARTLAFAGNEFAASLIEREEQNKYMSEAQVSWVYKLAQDALNDRNIENKIESIDASNILASVAEARARGIKKPVLRLVTESGAQIKIKYMSMGKNAGGCWVTLSDNLVGKIDDCGQFTSRNQDLFKFIEKVNSDVQGALKSYGKITSHCGCCGLPLTNKKSIELGIGPICLDKYGLLAMA
jgi:hypothetical protein